DGSGTAQNLYTAYYYDTRGRVTQAVQSNLLGGHDVTHTVYTFTGKPAVVSHTHTASGKPTLTEVTTYTYDHAERLTKVEHTLGGVKVTLVSNTYDELGRLQSMSPHGNASQKLTYAYNLRDWLTGISGSKFSQNLYYNTGNGTPCYNGNISGMTWQAGNETTPRGYKFTYDGLNRLLDAVYGEGTSLSSNAGRFTEKVTSYDKNGNILGLHRYGQTGASSYGLIDNLTFTLEGNRLNRVDDAVTSSAYNNGFEFKDAVKQENEYAYDANGNLTKNLNRNISNIQYNFLNLPGKVTFGDGSTIEYVYAADGTKLRTKHVINGTTTTTDYCGNVVYENGVQKLLLTEAGYVTLADRKYHYYLQDHQGNNRVVLNQNGTVEEVNHYYPFGGLFASSNNVQPYKYNGKELDTKNGLNLYDYGARMYDPALGRFTTVDPSSESYYNSSPYAYCGNEPVGRVDPDGKDWRIQTYYNKETGKMEYKITVRAVLINNSSNQELDMKGLTEKIVNQVNDAYTTSGDNFTSTMNLQLRTVSSVDDIKDYEHVFQIVDQDQLTKKKGSVVMAETYMNSLDIRVGTNAVSNMQNNDDNRTFAHELGHSGGLKHTTNVENLMTQKRIIQEEKDGNYLKAIQLDQSQIRTIRDNYIHKKLNQHIPNWKQRIKMK
ncbi:RHS repeat-associated core domain-containing protein, partial [Bacteroides sp. AN502]|nr:RHS repeat-associated core domain-containing protein [Caecibacteroides pullorum]